MPEMIGMTDQTDTRWRSYPRKSPRHTIGGKRYRWRKEISLTEDSYWRKEISLTIVDILIQQSQGTNAQKKCKLRTSLNISGRWLARGFAPRWYNSLNHLYGILLAERDNVCQVCSARFANSATFGNTVTKWFYFIFHFIYFLLFSFDTMTATSLRQSVPISGLSAWNVVFDAL